MMARDRRWYAQVQGLSEAGRRAQVRHEVPRRGGFAGRAGRGRSRPRTVHVRGIQYSRLRHVVGRTAPQR